MTNISFIPYLKKCQCEIFWFLFIYCIARSYKTSYISEHFAQIKSCFGKYYCAQLDKPILMTCIEGPSDKIWNLTKMWLSQIQTIPKQTVSKGPSRSPEWLWKKSPTANMPEPRWHLIRWNRVWKYLQQILKLSTVV